MTGYILRRLGHAALVLLGVTLVVFVLIRLSGDPVRLMLPLDATVEQEERLRSQLGLDQPILVQYGRFLAGVVQGDFGNSLRHREPALTLVVERMPASLLLTAAGLGTSVAIGVPLGVLAATRRGGAVDRGLTVLALAGQSMPSFWLGILLILALAVNLRLFPPSGAGTWKHLVLPGLTLGAYSAALVYRLTRSAMLEVLDKEFVRTARAKGLGPRVVIWRHAFRNAALPVVTIIGLQFNNLIGGAIITETVFAYPGMSLIAVQAIDNRDFPVVQAFVFVLALAVTLVNLVTDLAYSWLNPQIRYG